MLWLKLLLAMATVAFSTLIGWFAAGKYRARRLFFAEFARFNEKYLAELSYERRQLGRFLAENSFEGEFGKTVETFRKKREANFSYPFLKKEEKADGENYFSSLGKGDAHTQITFFSAQAGRLGALKAESEREAKGRGELYLKLGLLAGLALVLLII